MVDKDFALALHLQEELVCQNDLDLTNYNSSYDALSVTDSTWELIDPNPDPRGLFLGFNNKYFWGMLDGVEVRWSSRMTLCAGLCVYEGKGGLCSIRLSEPLLKLRPRKDLVETLLHEMIHAYLFITNNNKDHDGHGPEFLNHMHRLNKATGAHITVYHDFNDEVENYRTHWWHCNGPCKNRKPFFGFVKRAMNRPPSSRDPWWTEHQNTCGGIFTKIREPDDYATKKIRKQQQTSTKTGKKVKKNSVLLDWLHMTSSDSGSSNLLRSIPRKTMIVSDSDSCSSSAVNSSGLCIDVENNVDVNSLSIDELFPTIKELNIKKTEISNTGIISTDFSSECNFRGKDFMSHGKNVVNVCAGSSLCNKMYANVSNPSELEFPVNVDFPNFSLSQGRPASDQVVLQLYASGFVEFRTDKPEKAHALDVAKNFHLKLPQVFEKSKMSDPLSQDYSLKQFHAYSGSRTNKKAKQTFGRGHSGRVNHKDFIKPMDIQACLSNGDLELGTIIRLSNFTSVCNPNYHHQQKKTENLELTRQRKQIQLDTDQTVASDSSFILVFNSGKNITDKKNLHPNKRKKLESGIAHNTTREKDNNINFWQPDNSKFASTNSVSVLPYGDLSFDENKTIACIINQIKRFKCIVHNDYPSKSDRNTEDIFSNIDMGEAVNQIKESKSIVHQDSLDRSYENSEHILDKMFLGETVDFGSSELSSVKINDPVRPIQNCTCCPSCGIYVDMAIINEHLDTCLN